MTRIRANDYGNKKQAILAHAAALFAAKGFESTTMVEVAHACGASKSHLYHYFASKEDLLFAILSEHIALLSAELSGIVQLALDAEERFERFIDVFVHRAAQSRNEHLVLMNDLRFLPAAQGEEVRQLKDRLTQLMVDLLQEINPGLMAEEDVQAPYALLLFGMMIWTFTWYRKSGAISPRELALRISQLFMQGFRTAQSPALPQRERPIRSFNTSLEPP